MTKTPDGSQQGQPVKTRKPSKRIDWEPIRRDYELGGLSLTELEVRYGTSESYICRKAKEDGWRRDVRARARSATSAALTEEIYKQLDPKRTPVGETSTVAKPSTLEAEAKRAVDQIVEVNKVVLLRHHRRFSRAGEIAEQMLEELAAQSGLGEHAEVLARILAGEDPDPLAMMRAKAAIERTVDLFRRSNVLSKLVDAVAKLTEAERKCLGMDEAPPEKLDTPAFDQIPAEKRMDAVMALLRG